MTLSTVIIVMLHTHTNTDTCRLLITCHDQSQSNLITHCAQNCTNISFTSVCIMENSPLPLLFKAADTSHLKCLISLWQINTVSTHSPIQARAANIHSHAALWFMHMHMHTHTIPKPQQTLHTCAFFICWHLLLQLNFAERHRGISLPRGKPRAHRFAGGAGGSVLLMEHMWTSPFTSNGHSLPSLMCLNQSGIWMNTPRASDIMEFPLLCSSQLRDSSFDISHRWFTRRGSPPTTPPDHRWVVYVEGGHLIAQRSNLQQFMLSNSQGAWL